MQSISVRVPWKHGLDLRPASRIVRVSEAFRARVRIRFGDRLSDAHSLLGLVVLCASLNAAVMIEADGEDEHEALAAVAACFDCDDLPPPATTTG